MLILVNNKCIIATMKLQQRPVFVTSQSQLSVIANAKENFQECHFQKKTFRCVNLSVSLCKIDDFFTTFTRPC